MGNMYSAVTPPVKPQASLKFALMSSVLNLSMFTPSLGPNVIDLALAEKVVTIAKRTTATKVLILFILNQMFIFFIAQI
jgi:hypothetical protein